MPSALPLHPKLVHLPLGLAVVVPLVTLALLVAAWRRWLPSRVWAIPMLLQLLLVVGGVAALKTGEPEWGVVDKLVPEAALEAHEEAAEGFVWAGGAVLALMLAAPGAARLAKRERAGRVFAVAAAAGTLVVLALAVRTGQAGGQLVYRHGAAGAYSSSPPVPPGGGGKPR